jgi:hypothetical protein
VTIPAPGLGPQDPDVAARVERITGTGVRELQRIGGQHSFGHYRVQLAGPALQAARSALSAG